MVLAKYSHISQHIFLRNAWINNYLVPFTWIRVYLAMFSAIKLQAGQALYLFHQIVTWPRTKNGTATVPNHPSY